MLGSFAHDGTSPHLSSTASRWPSVLSRAARSVCVGATLKRGETSGSESTGTPRSVASSAGGAVMVKRPHMAMTPAGASTRLHRPTSRASPRDSPADCSTSAAVGMPTTTDAAGSVAMAPFNSGHAFRGRQRGACYRSGGRTVSCPRRCWAFTRRWICRNCASRSGCDWPSRVLRFARKL